MPSGICLEGLTDKQIHQINVGECNIGRGWLNCDDKRVSRNHGIMKVYDDNSILLTAMHQNPLFYKIKGNDSLEVVHKDDDIALNIGDSFGLLPDSCWFKIVEAPTMDMNDTPDIEEFACIEGENDADIVCQPNNSPAKNGTQQEEELNTSVKRKLPSWFSSSDNKKRKSNNARESAVGAEVAFPMAMEQDGVSASAESAGETDVNSPTESNEQNKPDNTEQEVEGEPTDTLNRSLEVESPDHGISTDENISPVQIKPEPEDAQANEPASHGQITVKQEILDHGNDQKSNAVAASNSVKQESDDSQGGVSSSTTSRRESCMYGIRCYRRNVDHRAEQAHPGDSDYRRPTYADPPAGTPPCPFGMTCYRRNPEHFKQFSHPPSTNPKANRRAKRTAKQAKTVDDDDDDDDGAELDDEEPFGSDTTDDDYDPDKDSAAGSDVSFDAVDTQDMSPE